MGTFQPGIVPNIYVKTNPVPIIINANDAGVTQNPTIVEASIGNNLVVQYLASDFAGATKLFWFITPSMQGDTFSPLQIPHSGVTYTAPFGTVYQKYSIKSDIYEVDVNSDLSGVVIIPFLFNSVKFNAFTDAGTAVLTIQRNAPAVA